MQRTVDGELRKRQEILVQATYGHRVDLHRVEASFKCCVDTFERGFNLAHARDELELRGIERIERNVHARKPRFFELICHLRQQHAIRGHRNVLDTGHIVQGTHQIHDALAHEGLATRKTHAAYADARGNTRDGLDLLDAQDLVMAHHAHTLCRHAVNASEIAPVRQRYAQIVNNSSV